MALLSYSEKYKLRESDFDGNDNIRASALLDIFQTIAGMHATRLGIGFEPTFSKGLVWVLTKVKYDCFRPFAAGETITATTCPQPKGLIDYMRDYFITGEDGELAAKATSQWVLVDYRTRKISKAVLDFEGEFVTERAYESKRIERVAPFVAPAAYTHTIARSEIDHNGHTNNIRYADMCFNAADLPGTYAKRVFIDFMAETRLGDKIDVATARDGNAYLFCGTVDAAPSFTARMEF